MYASNITKLLIQNHFTKQAKVPVFSISHTLRLQ